MNDLVVYDGHVSRHWFSIVNGKIKQIIHFTFFCEKLLINKITTIIAIKKSNTRLIHFSKQTLQTLLLIIHLSH